MAYGQTGIFCLFRSISHPFPSPLSVFPLSTNFFDILFLGSGKTYSMLGPGFEDAKSDNKISAILGGHARGLIPR